MKEKPIIAAAGAGRMGRGIAIVFAFAGHDVHLIDLKPRSPEVYDNLKENALHEIRTTLSMLAEFGMMAPNRIEAALGRVHLFPLDEAAAGLGTADYIFEAVPETLDAKEDAFSLISSRPRRLKKLAKSSPTKRADTCRTLSTRNLVCRQNSAIPKVRCHC